MKDGTAVEISASLAGHILDMLRDKIRRTEEKMQAGLSLRNHRAGRSPAIHHHH